MSVRYLLGDDVVWNPTEQSDAVFRSLVTHYEHRSESPSGLVWVDDREAHIDHEVLASFAQRVVDEWEDVGSTMFHVLVDGFLAALQVVCERSGIELDVSDRAYALAASMRHNM